MSTSQSWSHSHETSSHGAVGGFRKSKSCQKHPEMCTGLPNYVLMTERKEEEKIEVKLADEQTELVSQSRNLFT